MDSAATGTDRRHLTWRDLPATPPVGPTWTYEPVPAPPAPVAAATHRPSTLRHRGLIVGSVIAAMIGLGAFAVVVNPSAASDARHTAATAPQSGGGAGGAGNGSANARGGGRQGGAPVAPAPSGNTGGSAGSSGSSGAAGTSGSAEPLADTAARILPSVVQIETGQGLGTGFVADGNGDILTANHVVNGFSNVTIKLQDGTTVPGVVVAADNTIDTAVVKIERTDIPALTLADSDQVRVGQLAIAVGSPFGLDETVTSGIVSALNRTLDTDSSHLNGLIQTDAPINPGNSGGPLTDRDGNVIGINDAIASTSGQSSGVGFAVPINDAKRLLEQAQNGTATAPQQGSGNQGGQQGQGTDPFGGNGGNPFGGTNPFGGNGSNPFGGTNPFGGNGGNPFGGNGGQGSTGNSQADAMLQWFLQQVLPQLNGQSQGQ